MTHPTSFQIAVLGAGYVGLTTAACLAHLGHHVATVDVDEAKVDRLSRGECPILEERLEEMIGEGLSSHRLSFSTDAEGAVKDADFVFLCVPTPQGADGSADLRFVEAASARIGPHLKRGAVVVTKSTVPVGSAGKVLAALGRSDTAVVSNPEFLREGTALEDWLHPDRVVIGAEDHQAAEKLALLYEPLGAPVVVTDPASSETIKYAANAFLAAKVSFVNSIAVLCEAVGADAAAVITGMGFDRRIGSDHLSPGPGWGGSCFPKDTAALIRVAEDYGYDFALLKAVVAANEAQLDWVASQVEQIAGGDLDGATVAAWGLTFKAGTDDLRDSPAIAVLRRLQSRGANLRAYDPTRPAADRAELAGLGLHLCEGPYEALHGASVLVVLTEWPELRDLDLRRAASLMEKPHIVDTRNLYASASAKAAGFTYLGMGRR